MHTIILPVRKAQLNDGDPAAGAVAVGPAGPTSHGAASGGELPRHDGGTAGDGVEGFEQQRL